MRRGAAFAARTGAFVLGFLASGCAVQSSPFTALPNQPNQTAQTCSDKLSRNYERIDLTIEAQGRSIPFTLFTPEAPGEYPLIAFSHGAFAAPGRYQAMLGPLAASGYIVTAPMHVDSEEINLPQRPSRDVQWRTRNEDMALALGPPDELKEALNAKGLIASADHTIAMGHSFGALMAQFAGGAMALETGNSRDNLRAPSVTAVIGWSPPGLFPGRLDAETWSTMSVPSLTLTGTADVLPGFVGDWESHKASYDNAPADKRALWVGEAIDHYFGGVFGRVKEAPGDANNALFQRALATTLHFIETHSSETHSPEIHRTKTIKAAPQACTLGPVMAGETFEDIP